MENADLHWNSSIEKLQNTDNCVRTRFNRNTHLGEDCGQY